MSLAAIHLREEPDALMSARPGLCGEHRAHRCPYRDRQLSVKTMNAEPSGRVPGFVFRQKNDAA
jgi:hypothetical protein